MYFRNLTLTLLLAICSGTSVAQQQPFPTYADNPQWSIWWGFWGVGNGTWAVQYSGDTAMCGHMYSIVANGGAIWEGPGYFRNDGQRTLFRTSTNCSDPERVIYDYSAVIGDTLDIGMSQFDTPNGTVQFLVDTIEIVNIVGIERRRFKMYYRDAVFGPTDPFYRYMYWLEGIGSTTHPFFPLACLQDGCETFWSLSCYDSLDVPVYRSSSEVTCHQNVGINDQSDSPDHSFSVASDGHGQLLLYLPRMFVQGTITLFDATGRICMTAGVTAATSVIECEQLRTGVFTAVLSSEQGRRWSVRWVNIP